MTDIFSGVSKTDPRILEVTLNRPPQRNAMSQSLVDELLALLDDVEAKPEIAVLVLQGAGKGFCAGSDLTGLAAMTPEARSTFEADSGKLARRISAFPKPVLACVHGFAIGGGLTLAAACDIVFTTAAAKWSLPEVPIGLFPAWGLAAVTARIGVPAARRLSWGIDTLNGEQAVAMGLADALADDPLAASLACARLLAALPPSQSAAVKAYFAAPSHGAAADALANRLFMAATQTPAAMAAFAKYGAKPPGST